MAITFVSSSGAEALASSVEVTAPANIQDGDILVAFCQNSGTANPTFPSGFTQWCEGENTTSYLHLAWKRASSESGNYTFTASGARTRMIISVYRGCLATGDPADQISNTVYTTSNTTVRAAGFTTSEETTLVWGQFSTCSPTTCDVPSGFTERKELIESSTYITTVGDLIGQAAGATGNQDGTLGSATTNKHAFMVALKPVAATAAFIPGIMQTHIVPSFLGG